MTVRRYRTDPRGPAERAADQEVLRRFEANDFLQVDQAAEREAIEHVQRRYRSRRELVATLGKELGVLRRAHGLTQGQVARAVGTNKSNISRLESGRYGGLTIERFIAVLEAFQALAGCLGKPRNALPTSGHRATAPHPEGPRRVVASR